MGKFNPVFLVFLFLLWGCDPDISTNLKIDTYLEQNEVTKLLTKPWLLVPFVPLKGMGNEFFDYGDFLEKIEEVRASQKVTLFGTNLRILTDNQVEVHKEYIRYVRENHRIPDSLVFSLVGNYDARVLITPLVFSHQVSRTRDGIFQKRMAIKLKVWDIRTRKIVLEGSAASIHSSEKKESLVSGQKLFNAGLEALSERLLYHPLAGLTPQSSPDY